MQEEFEGMTPTIAESAFVSKMAYLVGEVFVADRASLWPFVCLRGDRAPVHVGKETNVQEFTMLHGAELGDEVTVGHDAVIDFATVQNHALVGMQSAILRGAIVESNCIVAANTVVLQDQVIPEGHMAYGTPAETKPLTEDQLEQIYRTHEHYVNLSRRFKS
ncbi:gamma carbonic anhydrase family protein [Haladaptatus pallidirubidus]|uniref:Gamma carbonic anhydrase family protein n=1 Tax=Haladaptatus pallidirubidus TaxID=1008152 RepID=A0AAV3UNT3_9EURY|nr:gamma carbonic anhydrase family protein [Haladaptatus pallidirubidus]